MPSTKKCLVIFVFLKLLEDIGMPVEEDQFNLLIETIGFPNGGLSYLDFVAIFEGNCMLTNNLSHSFWNN